MNGNIKIYCKQWFHLLLNFQKYFQEITMHAMKSQLLQILLVLSVSIARVTFWVYHYQRELKIYISKLEIGDIWIEKSDMF